MPPSARFRAAILASALRVSPAIPADPYPEPLQRAPIGSLLAWRALLIGATNNAHDRSYFEVVRWAELGPRLKQFVHTCLAAI